MTSVDRVKNALDAGKHHVNVLEFPAGTKTAADAAAAIGCSVAQIAKSLIFRIGDDVLLILVSGTNRVSLSKIESLLGQKVSRADADWVREKTGFAIGGVSPVGHQTKPLVLLDEDLLKLDPVWAAAGSPTHVFQTSAAALVQLTGARVADVREA